MHEGGVLRVGRGAAPKRRDRDDERIAEEVPHPGAVEDGEDVRRRVRGADHHGVACLDRRLHPVRDRGRNGPDEFAHLRPGVGGHPVLEERDAFGAGIDEEGGIAVGHREDGRPDLERAALALDRLGQGQALVEERCPGDLDGPGAVADREGFAARHLREVVMGGVGVALDPPPPAGVEDAGKEEDGGVDIRRTVAARYPEILGGIRDHGDLAVVEDLADAPDERGRSGSAGEEGDHG